MGIGIIDKGKDISPGNWIGSCKNSYGTWDRDEYMAYHAGKTLDVTHKIKIKQGDIVTVDLNCNTKTLNWAINGQYLSIQDQYVGIATPAAVAASLWKEKEKIEIIQSIRYH